MNEPVAAHPGARARPSRYAWFVVALLWFVAVLNYLDRLMITTMRDPIRADIPISDKQFALFTSVFLWVYAVVSPFGGFLADRAGRRGVISASLLFWSAATLLNGFARTFDQMLLARALMGVSEACYIPAALALIADYHPGPTRSLATGLHMVGIYVGAALGGVGGYLAEHFGWRFGFRVCGAVGIGYCLVLILCLRDAAGGPGAPSPGDESHTRFPEALASLLHRRGFQILLALNLLVGVANWAIYGWLPTYLKGHFNLGLGAAGLSATFYIQAASFAGVLIGGALADAWRATNPRARALVPAIGFCIAGPFLAAAASTSLLAVAVVGLLVFGLGRGAFDANQMPLLREVADQRYSATGYGVLNFVSTTAGGLMVFGGGALLDAHVDLARVFQACGAALLAAGVMLFAIKLPPPSRRHAVSDIL